MPMNTAPINTLFSRIMFYTSVESILYQAILCSHQIMLFRVADAHLYGQASALFSGIFLLVLYLNAGLDISLAPLFAQAVQSKNNFKQIIFRQLLGIAYIPVALTGIYLLASRLLPDALSGTNSAGVIILCALLVIVESAKKTVRTLLHLGLLQKTVALVEIATLCAYVSGVWVYIMSGRPLSLYIIFVPMLISSTGALCIYIATLYKFYSELSDTPTSDICWKSIGCMRLKNWAYQIVHSLYSSNFLVLSIALHYGLELAALLKVMSFCVYSINYSVQHIFGIASNVLLAHVKDRATSEMQQIFATVRSRLSYVLLLCPAALLAYHWYLQIFHPGLCAEQVHIMCLFMILLFSENIAVTHEQYFIVAGRTGLLIACNVGLLIPSVITHRNLCPDSPAALLYILLAIRLGNFLCLHYADRFSHMYNFAMLKKYRLLFAEKWATNKAALISFYK